MIFYVSINIKHLLFSPDEQYYIIDRFIAGLRSALLFGEVVGWFVGTWQTIITRG